MRTLAGIVALSSSAFMSGCVDYPKVTITGIQEMVEKPEGRTQKRLIVETQDSFGNKVNYLTQWKTTACDYTMWPKFFQNHPCEVDKSDLFYNIELAMIEKKQVYLEVVSGNLINVSQIN